MRSKHLLCLPNQDREALIDALNGVFEVYLIKFIFTDQGVVGGLLQSNAARLGLTNFCGVIILSVEVVLAADESLESLLGVE